MKITIEGNEDECRAATIALAMGFQERHEPRWKMPSPMPMSREEFLERNRAFPEVLPVDQRDALLKSLEGSDQSHMYDAWCNQGSPEHGYVRREVRECCKTDACRLPKSHPDYRSDP